MKLEWEIFFNKIVLKLGVTVGNCGQYNERAKRPD